MWESVKPLATYNACVRVRVIKTGLKMVLGQYGVLHRPKYKRPFSMDYRDRGSHSRYVYPTKYLFILFCDRPNNSRSIVTPRPLSLEIRDVPNIRSRSGFTGYPMFFSISGIRYFICLFNFKILFLLYFDNIFLRIHYYLVVVSKLCFHCTWRIC